MPSQAAFAQVAVRIGAAGNESWNSIVIGRLAGDRIIETLRKVPAVTTIDAEALIRLIDGER